MGSYKHKRPKLSLLVLELSFIPMKFKSGKNQHASQLVWVVILFPLFVVIPYRSEWTNTIWVSKYRMKDRDVWWRQREEGMENRWVIPSHDTVFYIWLLAWINSVCLMRMKQPSCLMVLLELPPGCEWSNKTRKEMSSHLSPYIDSVPFSVSASWLSTPHIMNNQRG